ncbi:MAG: family 43 glycosylhydrolase [Bacteroidales bacterium]|nr:family 43 glycosylhydrolase [Bacteroidales bacterium]
MTGFKFAVVASSLTSLLTIVTLSLRSESPRMMATGVIPGEMLENGDFSDGTSPWTMWIHNDASASGSVENGEFHVSITNGVTVYYYVQLMQTGLTIENGQTYRVFFDAYAESFREMDVHIQKNGDPWTYYDSFEKIQLTESKQTYTLTFTMSDPTDVNARLIFEMGNADIDVYIDNVSLSVSQEPQVPFQRGINLTGWFQYVSSVSEIMFRKYSREDLEDIMALGIDHIRLPIEFFDMTGPAPDYILDPLFFYLMDQVVDLTEELGLYLILDNHSFDPTSEITPDIIDELLAVWTQMADHYKNHSGHIYYEILNEPHTISDEVWNGMQQQVIDAIRSVDNTHTIIISPADWGGYNSLDLMPEYNDMNLLYTFHFYDPWVFTSQGSYWSDPPMENLSGIPYPYDAERMPGLPSELSGTYVEDRYNAYPEQGNDAWIQSQINKAVRFMMERDIPLWCGEFGVFMPKSPPADRLRWLKTVRSYLEDNGIPWCMWEYGDGFGIFDNENRELFDYDINIPVIEALGLKAPAQHTYELLPDEKGFSVYDDYIGRYVFKSNWLINGTINYYSQDDPAQGNFCMSWTESDLYGLVGFLFSPIHDISLLHADDYMFDAWVRCNNHNAKFDIRFLDSDTDDPDDHPWRMRYTVDNTVAVWDGTWQHIRIPLNNFTEQGAYENNTWYNPRGDFDWSQVERLEFAAEYGDIHGMEISFDDIKITGKYGPQEMYNNPVIPGFHPDPGICRVGEDYYLVTSTFEYFPGVPVFHSRDLINWHQIGHCLTRKSQLNLDKAAISGGIFAPTIRYHNGIYYMITMNTNYGGNFYVTAIDPSGPWSEPVWLGECIMDASLLFDDNGTVYYTRHAGGENGYIAQRTIDLATGQLQGSLQNIWEGTGGIWPEGPHLYKINDTYYLMIAEGGTSYNHMETIARSGSPWGPFTANPYNPILTHKNHPGEPIQALGHGDLVETPAGWWMVCLGIRPRAGNYHHLGRETFLVPVSWNDEGWPVVNDNNCIQSSMPVPHLMQHEWPPEPVRDDFDSTGLRLPWNFVRNPYDADWSLTERPGFLRLNGSAVSLKDQDSPAWIGRRQTSFNCLFATLLEFTPVHENEEAGLIIRGNDLNHYESGITYHSGNRCVFFRKVLKGLTDDSTYMQIPEGPVRLEVHATDFEYLFYYQHEGEALQLIGCGSTKDLSTEVIGGFTGVYAGMFATGNGQPNTNPADFDWFVYDPDTSFHEQIPYYGLAVNIPGKIEAENYDKGAAWIAWWDSDAGNAGGQFRSDDVDIESTTDAGGGYNIGYTADGEWMEYTVTAGTDMKADIDVRVASIYSYGQLLIMLDGETLGTVSIPNTGGWQVWQTITLSDIPVKKGRNKILRLGITGGGFNINWIQFTQLIAGDVEKNVEEAEKTIWHRSYPNPFSRSSVITYSIPERSLVLLEIFDMLGRKVCTLENTVREPGRYNVEWSIDNGGQRNVQSGIYLCILRATGTRQTYQSACRMILIVP